MPSPPHHLAPAPPPPPHGEPGGVLVVDDDDDLRTTLREVLTEEGVKVQAVANGREALRALGDGLRPRLILLDLFMPEMSGAEFRAHQRSDQTVCDIPVVVMSAATHIERLAAPLAPAAILQKPMDLRQVLELVERWCA